MKKVLNILLWSVLGIGIIATFYYLYQKSQPKEIVYQIEKVTVSTIEKRTLATGKVEPRNEILLKPQMSGIISEIYKVAGEKVKAGDIIAKIEVVPEMVNLSASTSRVARAKLNYNQSQKEYQRNKKLYEKQVISKEEFEKSTLQYLSNQEELKSATDNLNLIKSGKTPNSAYSNTLVRSTISGTILNIPIKVGNSVIQSNNFNDGTTVATVADMTDMLFVGKLDETEVGRVHVGMPMTITIGAMENTSLKATLEQISPKGQEEGGAVMFAMKAAINIPKNLFVRAGYSANADILLQQATDVLTIPESCVQFSNDSTYVYQLTQENPQQFRKTYIELGLSDGINVEIKKGLEKKQKIRGTVIADTP